MGIKLSGATLELYLWFSNFYKENKQKKQQQQQKTRPYAAGLWRKRRPRQLPDLVSFGGKHHLTASKAVPLRSIDDAPRTIKGGSTPVCVVVWHGGMVVCICAGQLPKNLTSKGPKERAQSQALTSPVVSGWHLHPLHFLRHPSLPVHQAWETTSCPREGVWKGQRDRKLPAPHREDWQTGQMAGTWATSSQHKSLVPPTGQMYNCEVSE